MTTTFLSRFPKQLGHWIIHGFCNALPSFIIAVAFLKLHDRTSISAMLAAVGLFVVAFATVTSWPGVLSEPGHLLPRSIRLGARVRSWIAGLSLLLLPFGNNAFSMMPDFWCGFAAALIQDSVARRMGMPNGFLDRRSDDSMTFLPVFTVTLLEGLIISILLLMISFFCLIILQARERRSFLRSLAEQNAR